MREHGTGCLGRVAARWVKVTDLHSYDFVPADLPVVEKLKRTKVHLHRDSSILRR